MTPMLGKQFVRPVTIGIMDEMDFETVKMEAQPYRPLNRVKKDIRSRKVILSPDCVFLDSKHLFNTFGHTLSIEVKPKAGFFIPNQYSKLCQRCLKQEAKLNEGDIDCISKYCPLDLFSGDLSRMKRAIFDLFESPHNRFKIFKNGNLIYTDKIGHQENVDLVLNDYFGAMSGSGTNRLASILSAAMLNLAQVSQELYEMMPKTKKSPETCDNFSKPLPKDCILDILLKLQKYCTEVDDLTAESLSHKLMTDSQLSMDDLHNLTIWYPLLTENNDTETILAESMGFSPAFIQELKQLQKFLLSVTAKDVSILFTFRPIFDSSLEESANNEEFLPTITMERQMYRVMISVIDLDPKPVHRIPTWIEKRQDWLKKSYLQK